MFSNPDDLEPPDLNGKVFIGQVVDNNDPKKLERVRVTIPGLYEGSTADLPWCAPKVGKMFGNKAGVGVFSVPDLGTWVFVELQDGNAHYPLYTGSPVQTRADLPEADANYPNRYGFKDKAGNIIYVDPTSGQNTIRVQHASGTEIRINNDGSINITAVATITSSAPQWNHTGNMQLTGNLVQIGNQEVTGDITATGTITGETDVIGGGNEISLETHRHGGVFPGGSQTAPPTP